MIPHGSMAQEQSVHERGGFQGLLLGWNYDLVVAELRTSEEMFVGKSVGEKKPPEDTFP